MLFQSRSFEYTNIKLVLFSVFLFSALLSSAQRSDSLVNYPKYAIGFSPSALFNIYGVFQIGQDFRINEQWGVNVETGFVYTNNTKKDRKVRGIVFRPELDYILDHKKRYVFIVGGFYLLKYASEKFNFIEKSVLDGVKKKIPVARNKTISGIGIIVKSKGRITDRLLLNLGAGLGYGTMTIKDSAKDPNRTSEFFNKGNRFDYPGKVFYPIIFTNIGFSIIIFK